MKRAPAEQPDQDHDDARQQPMGELDQGVLVTDERDHVAPAERPALGPAPAGSTAEAGVAHAHDTADDDQQECDKRSEVCQAAKPTELLPAAAGQGSGHGDQATGSVVSAGAGLEVSWRRMASRMSRSGSSLRTSGTTSKLCGGGGEVANHSSVSPPQGSCPARVPRVTLR